MIGSFLSLPRGTSPTLWIVLILLFLAVVGFGINLYLNPSHWEGYTYMAKNPPQSIADVRFAYEAARNAKIIRRDGKRFLFGGPQEQDHFDITEFTLDPARLNYGLGREAFPALIVSEFESGHEADEWLDDQAAILTVKLGDEVRVYPVDLLIRHEIVNDVVEGKPIFAAYCILANLGAVYEREFEGNTFTFALSGYTYADPEVWGGRNAFVFWDRETESLWWPPIGKAVSGPMINCPLRVLDEDLWAQTTWGEIKKEFPNAMVLKQGQDFERPTEWEKIDIESRVISESVPVSEEAIAPQWGENSDLIATSTESAGSSMTSK